MSLLSGRRDFSSPDTFSLSHLAPQLCRNHLRARRSQTEFYFACVLEVECYDHWLETIYALILLVVAATKNIRERAFMI